MGLFGMLRRIHGGTPVGQGMILMDADVRDAGLFIAKEGDVFPDALVGKARPPVPAEHAVRLSEVRKAPHGLERAAEVVFTVLFLNIFGGRVDRDRKDIALFLQEGGDVIFPRAMHVVRAAKQHAV